MLRKLVFDNTNALPHVPQRILDDHMVLALAQNYPDVWLVSYVAQQVAFGPNALKEHYQLKFGNTRD